MNSPLADAINSLPNHLTKADLDDLPALLGKLSSLAESYGSQSIALTFLEFVRSQGEPSFGFELSIDREDGIYYLYCNDVDGIEVDEDHFDSDEDMDEFCTAKVPELEGFAQELNDSPWREDAMTQEMVAALNDVNWQGDKAEQVIAKVLKENGVDAAAFFGSLKSSEEAKQLSEKTPVARPKSGRRSL